MFSSYLRIVGEKITPLFISLFVFICIFNNASSQSVTVEAVETELVSEFSTVSVGQSFNLGWRLRMQPGWHVYWKNPGDTGIANKIEWNVGNNIKIAETKWPRPEKIVTDPLVSYGYSNEVMLLFPTVISSGVGEIGDSVNIKAKVTFLMCKDVCLPGEANLNTSITIGNVPIKNNRYSPLFFRTKNSQVKPFLGDVNVSYDSGEYELSFLTSEINLDSEYLDVEFWPQSDEIIEDIAEQTIVLSDGLLKLKVPVDRYINQPVKNLAGIIVINGKGYSFSSDVKINGANVAVNKSEKVELKVSDNSSSSFLVAIVGAFFAGLILNLMPCVLPVLSLKVMSLVKTAHGVGAKGGALSFTLGVVSTFWLLAIIIEVFKIGGQSIGWGFQLQSPMFVAAMAVLMLILALMFFGVFHVGVTFGGLERRFGRLTGISGSFFTGCLTTLVSTPCTVPFMGAAVAYALTEGWYINFIILSTMGLGLALPVGMLATFPNLLKFVPKPGVWMLYLKQFLGFPLLATVIWLWWVFGRQLGDYAQNILALCLFVLSLVCWVYGKYHEKSSSSIVRFIATLTLISSAVLAFYVPTYVDNTHNVDEINSNTVITKGWERWSADSVNTARARGENVFIDFTADWCITCKVNEKLVLHRESARQLFAQNNTTLFIADWTDGNESITKELSKFGRKGVPLYVFYKNGSNKPVILPQILTMGDIEGLFK